MASYENRVAENVPGRFYVDNQCIYCGLCDETAPTVFRGRSERDYAFVFRQPATEEELRLVMESVENCPSAAIGVDGR